MGRHRIYEDVNARMRAYRARLALRSVTESPADAEIERLRAKVRDLEAQLALRSVTESPSAPPSPEPRKFTEWERKIGLAPKT
jgi:hypothetical protein